MKKSRFFGLLALFCTLLAVLILVNPMEAQAATVTSGECGTEGDNMTWALDDEGTLTISGTGTMTDWDDSFDVPWYSSRSSIKKVVIESGVTTIGK